MKHAIKTMLCLAIVLAIACASCKKKSKEEEQPAPANGTLYLHLHTDIDTLEVDSGRVAPDASGRRFQLDIVQFYLSGITLKKADGSSVSTGNVYLLKTISKEEYMVGSLPAGNYLSVSFNVGLDAAANQAAPSSHAAGDPLSAQNPNMWFGNTSQGYMFMNIQGKADTSASNNGPVNCPFSYQLGTSAMLKTVTMPNKPFTIASGQSQLVHLQADYGKLLQGINFKTQGMATPFVNGSVATQIANNIPSIFSYEQ